MVLGLRYHIFTITAIFTALGLGILIGTSIIGNDRLIEEQNKIISNIGDNISKLKTENSRLKNNIDNLEKKLSNKESTEMKLLSFMLGNHFSGDRYLLYAEKSDNLKKVKEIFNNAGVDLKILNSIENLNSMEKDSQLILWNIKKENISEKIRENSISCSENDIFELIITLMENRENGENVKKSIGNNSSL